MKILLLTDIPPSKDYTAGIVLNQLVRFLPGDTVVCYCVHNARLKVRLSPDLDFPVAYDIKPRENWNFLGPVGTLSSSIVEGYYETIGLRKLTKNVVRFGKTHGVDRLWGVLQGQTMIRLATRAAGDLQVPLLTQIWDPPHWWLRANRVDPCTSSRVIRQFGEAVRKSRCCATASVPMAEDYRKRYGTKTIAFLPSLGSQEALPPSVAPHCDDEFTIGIAGQIYARDAWSALLHALAEHDWNVQGRNIRIQHIGNPIPVEKDFTDRITLCGWKSQEETIRLLSGTDLTYCPYWFDPVFENEARMSFPSKLTTYYASGRPVLFHGPPYAAPARFIETTQSGICCYSLDHHSVISSLAHIIENPRHYGELTARGREVFLRYLTLDTLKQNFIDFTHSTDYADPPASADENSILTGNSAGPDDRQ